MGNIPTIPGTGTVQDQQIGVRRDVRPQEERLSAESRTIGAAARTVNQAADVVQDYEERKRRAEEVAAFNKTSIVLNKGTQDFRSRIKTLPDQQIVPNWEQYSKSLSDQVLSSSGITGPAQHRLAQHLATWKSDTTVEFQVAADKIGSQRRQSTAQAAAEEFLKSGDPALMPNAKAAVDSAVKAGDWTPEKAKRFTDQFPERVAEYQAQNAIDANPYKATQMLKDGTIKITDPNKLRVLMGEAGERTNAVQGSTLQDYMSQIQNATSPLQYPTMDELKGSRDTGKLSARGMNQLVGFMKKSGLADSQSNFKILMADMSGVQLSGESKPQETIAKWKEDAAAIHDPVLQKRAMDGIRTQQNALEKKTEANERPGGNRHLPTDEVRSDDTGEWPDQGPYPED